MEQEILSNTIGSYIWFFSWIIAALLFKNLLAKVVIVLFGKILKKALYGIPTKEFYTILRKPLSLVISLIFLYVSVSYIDFPSSWNIVSIEEFGVRSSISTTYKLVLGFVLTFLLVRLMDALKLVILAKYEVKASESSTGQVIPFAIDFSKVLVVIFSVFLILSIVFEINIGALVAGLGIGGLAVALAAKDTFENLLGSFIIFFDKPFEIGDFIRINNVYYTVEKVGLRSTRLRTLEQTRMTMPNKLLVESNIDNYTLRHFRRVDRVLPLERTTAHSKMIKVVEDIKAAITQHELSTEDIFVNLHEISNYSLDIRIQYYIDTKDWPIYLGAVQEVNLRILEILENNEVKIAYPTTNVQVGTRTDFEIGI